MAKWKLVYSGPEPTKSKHKIHCFDCKKDVPTLAQAGRDHRGHECEYVPDPEKN